MEVIHYWEKVLRFFGLKEGADDYQQQEIHDNKIVSIRRDQQLKLVFHSPDSFDEVKAIADDLKSRRPIILNLETLEHNLARKFIDFLSGVVYGINGSVQKVGNEVFLFTPSNIEIDGKKIKDTLEKNSISN